MSADLDVAVIGAGAAGLTAAAFAVATAPEARVAALESAARLGAKILISGGGRCNVTHDVVTADDFNGNRNTIARVLRTFTVEQTVAWLASYGVTLKREETGKLFPTTDRARTIVDALLRACQGAEIRTGSRVESVTRVDAGFLVATARGSVTAERVILATGGRSVPKTGSDGHGYDIARSLGHTITDTFPALVPLLFPAGHPLTRLSGVTIDVELSVRAATGRVLVRHRGSMLFTHFGVSGPVVLDASRDWIAARRAGDSKAHLTVSFLPDTSFEQLEEELLEEARANPRATVISALRGRTAERVLEQVAGDARLGTLPREERRRVVRDLLELRLPVERDRGFDYAEVTAGGVPLAEIDPATMQSRRCRGLYLCGEILDVDGHIGGYNFQWAWASGRLAGIAAARPR